MGWLDNDVALVTGGGSGIGLAVVRRFLAEGARGVGVLLRDPRQAEALKEEFGARVHPVRGDVRVYADHERAVAETVAAYGKLDTLVGNAGMWDFFSGLMKGEPDALAAAADALVRHRSTFLDQIRNPHPTLKIAFKAIDTLDYTPGVDHCVAIAGDYLEGL